MKKIKKGRRVRIHDYHLIRHTFLLLNVPFLILNGLIFYFYIYEKGIYSSWNDHYLLMIAIVVLSLLLSIYLYYSSNPRIVLWLDKKKHRQMLARMIVDHNYYISEKVEGSERVTYFPKVYYRYENDHLFIRFPLRMEPFQADFLKLSDTMEIAFSSDLYNKTVEKEFVCYELLYMPSKLRVTLSNLNVTNRSIEIMRGIEWEFAKVPHALIAGGTGSGKTFLLNSIIWSFAKIGADLTICDPKNADLSKLRYVPGFEKKVFVETNQIAGAVRRFREEMDNRMIDFEKRTGERAGLNYYDLDYKPHVLVIDEYNSFITSFIGEVKSRNEVQNHIQRIVMLGRQLGFFIVIGMQRPDGEYLHTAVRDNLGLRVGLGKLSSVGNAMVFGDLAKDLQMRDEKGYGYCFNGFGEVFQFYAPYIEKDFDFIKEMKQLYKIKGDQKEVVTESVDVALEDLEAEIDSEETENLINF